MLMVPAIVLVAENIKKRKECKLKAQIIGIQIHNILIKNILE